MKSVLLSIRPQWCELIASGKKTVEVRKTAPKLKTPFKVYMYCTKNGRPLVYAEPTPYDTEPLLHRTYGWNRKRADEIFGIWNRKVIGEFVCDKVDKYRFSNYAAEYDVTHVQMAQMCLNLPELIAYGTGDPLYGWHISDLKIYEDPKELGEFVSCNGGSIKRPFQSWGYVCLSK